MPVCSTGASPSFNFKQSQYANEKKTLRKDRDKEHISNEYERVKNENLRSAKEGKGRWKNELASESEASVKADRDETGVNGHGHEIKSEGSKKN